MISAYSLAVKTFPAIDPDEIARMLHVCAKNDGLCTAPDDEPDFLFAHFRYWPVIVRAVEYWDWSVLANCDLRRGPILHIAALITPTKGYSLTRELIDVLNPLAVSCHRQRGDGQLDFRFKRNTRYSGEKVVNRESYN